MSILFPMIFKCYMPIKRIILFLSITALFMGCKSEDYYSYIYRRSFAMNYYETEGIQLATYPQDDKRSIYFNVNAGSRVAEYKDTGEKKEIYDALCEKYGDMTYNREGRVAPEGVPSFQAYSFVSIEIVSNSDFDEKHPASSSLSDLVFFDSCSSKPYVDNGYVEYDWGDDQTFFYTTGDSMRPYYPINKKVSDLTPTDMKLLYGGSGSHYLGEGVPYGGSCPAYGWFHFESLPTLSKEHLITVTFTDERGETFSDSIEMTFE